jgi:prepilin-type N-terminal cleavage/methylation domain-containing protein
MTIPRSSPLLSKAFTLLEMSIVIMVMLALVSMGFISSKKTNEWKLGRTAAEALRSVWTAQRMYLADNPTATVSALTNADLIPYLPNSAAAIPTVKSLTGTTLTILVNRIPPVVNAGSGIPYDPSSTTTDLLWDVGQP